MIGKNIRGIRHLWRLANTSVQKILVLNGEDICIGAVIKVVMGGSERMFIFNDFYRQSNYSFESIISLLDKETAEKISSLNTNRVLEVYNSDDFENFERASKLFSEIYLLPETFDTDYEEFLKLNSKMITNLSRKYDFRPDYNHPKTIYLFCNGSKNFFEWAINLFYQASVSLKTIQNIMSWNDYYGQLSKNLSKGTITAYKTKRSLITLVEEFTKLRNEKRVNDTINSFNTAQKKILKSAELSEVDKETLSKFSKLSDTKRINFIKKMSTVTDFAEIMKQMRYLTSIHFEWNKSSFMDYLANVENIKYEIVADRGDIVLVKVEDYETIKHLGKTTNWCISKNKSYWDNYVERERVATDQYMIFDFSKLEDDKLSIIGLTTKLNKGITSAHNFINENLIANEDTAHDELKSYLRDFDGCKNIYKLLEKCGIDLSLVIKFDKPLYEWDRTALMDYLYECVNAENVSILKSDDSKMLISVRDENIRYFFGDAYIDNIPTDYWSNEHIIFIDFTKNKFDTNKVQFGIIAYGGPYKEDFCVGMYNEVAMSIPVNFDSKLAEFDVPYDIIRRPNDIVKRITNAFATFNINEVNKCLPTNNRKKILKEAIEDKLLQEQIYDIIRNSLDIISFDYLNLFYDNGLKLSDFLQTGYVSDLFAFTFKQLLKSSRETKILNHITDCDIDAFYNEKLHDRNLVMHIGSYLLLKKMIENEHGQNVDVNRIYDKMSDCLVRGGQGDLIKELFYLIIDKVDIKKAKIVISNFINYALAHGDDEMKESAKKFSSVSSDYKRLYESLVKPKNGRIAKKTFKMDIDECSVATVNNVIEELFI